MVIGQATIGEPDLTPVRKTKPEINPPDLTFHTFGLRSSSPTPFRQATAKDLLRSQRRYEDSNTRF